MSDDELDIEPTELLPELNGYELDFEEQDVEALDDGLLSIETDLEFDEEKGRSQRLARRRPLPSRFPGRPHRPRPRGVVRPVFRRKVVVRRSEPCICPVHGSEYTRWVQSSLKQILGQNLVVTGVMNRATREALQQFQQQQGLRTDGIAGPDTKRALLDAIGGGARDAAAGMAQSIDATESAADSELFEYGAEELETPMDEELDEMIPNFTSGQALEGEVTQITFFNWWVQGWLNAINGAGLALDGVMGQQTRNAVRAFQRSVGLMVDGVVGRATVHALVARGAFPPPGSPEYISWLQGFLNKALGIKLSVDGVLGPKTRKAVFDFQRAKGLTIDGVVGPETERVLTEVGCKLFFEEYEVRFNPGDPNFGAIGVSDVSQRRADVFKMVSGPNGLLLIRRNQRAAEALRNKLPAFATVSASDKKIAERLSQGQLELFREFFPGAGGGINVEPFQRCFEKFANGELRVGANGIGEPDGGFYFLFAEFAFLCVQVGIVSKTWEKVLRTFVKTQEIFMHVYRPSPKTLPPAVGAPLKRKSGGPWPLSDYDFSNFKQLGGTISKGKGQSDLKRKIALRVKYDSMGVGELEKAARDNFKQAQLMD